MWLADAVGAAVAAESRIQLAGRRFVLRAVQATVAVAGGTGQEPLLLVLRHSPGERVSVVQSSWTKLNSNTTRWHRENDCCITKQQLTRRWGTTDHIVARRKTAWK